MVPKMIANMGLNFSDWSGSSPNFNIASVNIPKPRMKPIFNSFRLKALRRIKAITIKRTPDCIFLSSSLGRLIDSMLAKMMVHPISDSMILI